LFWRQYERDTFRPWFLRYKLPPNLIDQILGSPSIDEDLEAWTLRDPTNPTFSSGGREATAAQMMRRAFAEAVASLIKKLGADPSGWGWGKLHTLEVDSLIGGPAIGPLPSGGDQWTVSSRHGGDYVSNAGPSWRMVVDWGTGQSVGVIPGGESEDFRSPWYKNQFDTWWHGQYYPMVDLATAQSAAGSITWTLQPTS
jgi:penicillin amidase